MASRNALDRAFFCSRVRLIIKTRDFILLPCFWSCGYQWKGIKLSNKCGQILLISITVVIFRLSTNVTLSVLFFLFERLSIRFYFIFTRANWTVRFPYFRFLETIFRVCSKLHRTASTPFWKRIFERKNSIVRVRYTFTPRIALDSAVFPQVEEYT